MADTPTTPTPPTADPTATIIALLGRVADRLDCIADAATAEALDPAGAARLCGVCVSKWHDLNSRGLCPSPARVGDSDRLPRWPRAELRAWLLAGAPSRQRWNSMRDAALRRIA
jgi:predicted DNA-binding transcriptional regulator AlpA